MSILGLGCVRFGSIAAGMDQRESVRLVHDAVERGITWLDTADAYTSGTSEHVLGVALRRRRPQSPVMAPAQGQPAPPPPSYLGQDFSPDHRTAALDASLRRRTDYIDVYQLHWYPAAGPTDALPWDLDAIGQWAETAKSTGKIDRLGIAAETLDQARQTTASDVLSVVQLPFGMLDPQAGDSLIPHMHESGRHVIVRCRLAMPTERTAATTTSCDE